MRALVVALLFLVAGVLAHEGHVHMDPETKKIVDDCTKESGLEEDVIKAIMAGKSPGHGPGRRKLDCFSSCMLIRNGMMRDDGTIIPNREPLGNPALEECKNLKGADTCETGGKIVGCFVKNNYHPGMHQSKE